MENKDRQKVLLLSHLPPPTTGIGSWTKKLLDLGLGNDWEIVLVNTNTTNGRDPFKNKKRSFFNEWKRSNNIWKSEKQYLKNDKDIRIVHTCIPCTFFGMLREIVCAKIAKRFNKKFILHCRCTVPNVVKGKIKTFVFKKLSKLCDGIIVLNEKSFNFVKSVCGTDVVIIPNFAESRLLMSEHKQINNDFKNLIYVGGVTSDKGCDRIIECAKEFPDLKFNLVGIVADDISKMEKPSNVYLYGNINNDRVKEILCDNDCFLFLSRFWGEGFSNALVEAMCAGLPCIVTDWAANKDMIENKGGIVISDNIIELKKAILKMYDSEFRRKCSIFNLNKTKSSYVDEVVIPLYVKYYNFILEKDHK